MTMMKTSLQSGLGDMEALLWGPSSPMADPTGSLLSQSDPEEPHGREGSLSFSMSSPSSSSSSPPPFYSPPPSPPGNKAGTRPDLLSLPWLAHPDQLGRVQAVADDGKGDAFCDFDWMTERMDLSEFDLDSLIGSCSADDHSPSSPEDFLASLDCPLDLDSLPTPALLSLPRPPLANVSTHSGASVLAAETTSRLEQWEASSPPPCVPEPQAELEIKSEPDSPVPMVDSPVPVVDSPMPVVDAPPSPAYALDLGSEVDVVDCEVKPVVATAVPPRIVLSLSPTRIVLLLAPKDRVGLTTAATVAPAVTAMPEVIHSSAAARPPRSRPYPDPKARPGPLPRNPGGVKIRFTRGAAVEPGSRATLKPPRDKKLKKKEQNKTAATRYRQKKRAEQEGLSTEYSELERKNIELTEKADSMVREIQYLKELMEEVRMARLKKGLSTDL